MLAAKTLLHLLVGRLRGLEVEVRFAAKSLTMESMSLLFRSSLTMEGLR